MSLGGIKSRQFLIDLGMQEDFGRSEWVIQEFQEFSSQTKEHSACENLQKRLKTSSTCSVCQWKKDRETFYLYMECQRPIWKSTQIWLVKVVWISNFFSVTILTKIYIFLVKYLFIVLILRYIILHHTNHVCFLQRTNKGLTAFNFGAVRKRRSGTARHNLTKRIYCTVYIQFKYSCSNFWKNTRRGSYFKILSNAKHNSTKVFLIRRYYLAVSPDGLLEETVLWKWNVHVYTVNKLKLEKNNC